MRVAGVPDVVVDEWRVGVRLWEYDHFVNWTRRYVTVLNVGGVDRGDVWT